MAPRKTRATSRAENKTEESTVVLADETQTTALSLELEQEQKESTDKVPKSAKGNKKKSKGKGKKGKKTGDQENAEPPVQDNAITSDVLEGDGNAPALPPSETVATSLQEDHSQDVGPEERPKTPTSASTRLTRRQLALMEAQKAQDESQPVVKEIVSEEAGQISRQVETEANPSSSNYPKTISTHHNDESETLPQQNQPMKTPQTEALAPSKPMLEMSTPENASNAASAATVEEQRPATFTGATIAGKRLESLFQPANPQDIITADSPIEEIIARSPLKEVFDHDDHITALDATEDAVEQFEKNIPIIDVPLSPIRKSSKVTKQKKPVTSGRTSPALKPTVDKEVGRIKHVASRETKPVRPAPLAKERSNRPAITKATRSPANISSPLRKIETETSECSTTELKPSEAQASKEQVQEVKKRSNIAALNTPPPVVKSSKPTTKSTFQLPGEAVTARLKAQREERIKRSEEEAQKKESKPKPALSRTKSVEVKQNAASRARMSLLKNDKTETAPESTVKRMSSVGSTTSATRAKTPLPRVATLATKPKDLRRDSTNPTNSVARITSSTASTTINKRPRPSSVIITPVTTSPSLAAIPKRPRPSSAFITSTSAGPVIHAPHTANTARPRVSTNPPPSKDTESTQTISQQNKRGKENLKLRKTEKEDQEKALKEKVEAAKRARLEAAERGRQASKEWASKQKAKLASSARSNVGESEKGSESVAITS